MLPLDPADPTPVERAAYDAAYKGVTDILTLYLWRKPAFHLTRWAAQAGMTPNMVTGIATAYMDSIPMVIITGQVPTPAIGLDAFQECDTVGITRPIVKHNFLVKDVRDLATTLKKAFHIARTGRPGPVLIDIPKDIQQHYPRDADGNYVAPRMPALIEPPEADAGAPGQPPVHVGHVGAALLVPRMDHANRVALVVQRVEELVELDARNAEDRVHAVLAR